MKRLLMIIMGVVFLLPTITNAYSPSPGDLIKTTSSPAVYFIGQDLNRHLFVNGVTFWTWFTGSWADQALKILSQEEFDSLSYGDNITTKPGAKYIKFDNSNIKYRVDQDKKICPLTVDVPDEDVVIIQSSFENDYKRDDSCDKTKPKIDLPAISIINYIGITNIFNVVNNITNNIFTPTTTNEAICYSDTWVCGNWGLCQSNNSQTRTCYMSQDCPSVNTPSPSISQSCNFNAPVCTSWTYSDWSTCSLDGKQTRTILQSYPSNCIAGNSLLIQQPILEQNCVSPVTINLAVNKQYVKLGDTVTLTWSTSNASSCTGSGKAGWYGAKETSGTYSFVVNTADDIADTLKTYSTLSLNCQNNTTSTTKFINVYFSYDGSYQYTRSPYQVTVGTSKVGDLRISADSSIVDKIVVNSISMRGLLGNGLTDYTNLNFALKDEGTYITPYEKCEQRDCNLLFDNLNIDILPNGSKTINIYSDFSTSYPYSYWDLYIGVSNIMINSKIMPSNINAILRNQ